MKNKIAILVDSSTSLSDKLKARLNKDLFLIPLLMIDDEEKQYIDNENLSLEIINKLLLQGRKFKTSSSNIGEIFKVVDNILEKFEKIIFIPISHGLSGQYQQSLIVQEDYEDKLFCFKSNLAISGIEFLVETTFQQLDNGNNNIEDIFNLLYKKQECVSSYFSCEDLTALIAGGRTNKAIIRIASIFKIKPIILMYIKNSLCSSAKNYKNVIEKITSNIIPKSFGSSWDISIIEKIYYCSAGCSEQKNNEILKIISENFKIDINSIERRKVPNAITVHTNIGSYGIIIVTKIPRNNLESENK